MTKRGRHASYLLLVSRRCCCATPAVKCHLAPQLLRVGQQTAWWRVCRCFGQLDCALGCRVCLGFCFWMDDGVVVEFTLCVKPGCDRSSMCCEKQGDGCLCPPSLLCTCCHMGGATCVWVGVTLSNRRLFSQLPHPSSSGSTRGTWQHNQQSHYYQWVVQAQHKYNHTHGGCSPTLWGTTATV